MTIPEYDEECDCDLCTTLRNDRIRVSRKEHALVKATEDPLNKLVFALFRRIGEQPELKDEWKKLYNAERSSMAGDFYNIIAGSIIGDCIKYERKRVLDVDTIGTLLNIIEKDCDHLTTLERGAYRKAKKVESKLRQGGE